MTDTDFQRITETGIYDLSKRDYHNDPCEAPSLSSTIAKELLYHSPKHAAFKHSRLNPFSSSEFFVPTKTMLIGDAVHNMVLRDGEDICYIPYDNYRTKDARDLKETALIQNQIPILEPWCEHIEDITSSVDTRHFENSEIEKTFVLKSEGTPYLYYRSMVDSYKIYDDEFQITDLKVTEIRCRDWCRSQAFENVIQAGFYNLILKKVLKKRPRRFRFLVVESKPPYGSMLYEFDNVLMDLCNRMALEAIGKWNKMMKCFDYRNIESYPSDIQEIECPFWLRSKYNELAGEEECVGDFNGIC